MTREPGFMGLAKQKAKKEGMFQVPKRYQPAGGGAEEYPAFLNQEEMALLRQQGGSGFMTPYGVPSFTRENDEDFDGPSSSPTNSTGVPGSGNEGGGYVPDPETPDKPDKPDTPEGGGGGNGETPEERTARLAAIQAKADAAAAVEAEAKAKREAVKKKKYEEKQRLKRKREGYIDGVMTDENGNKEGEEGYDETTASMKGGYEGYKGEVQDITSGTMQDDKGRTPDDPEYDEASGKMRGGFAGDVEKLDKYEDQFGALGTKASTIGDASQDYLQGTLNADGTRTGGAAKDFKDAGDKGAKTASNISTGVMTDATGKKEGEKGYDSTSASMKGGYDQITGQGMVDAATAGNKGFTEGASDVNTVQNQFGKEGFQKEAGAYQSQIGSMAQKAASGDVGQPQAAMLKGQMEEGRMASQKGSEEKLRREMAQSGASPAEIAAKVAQFQQQSANQQAQSGRSETLSSQLQGQQMGLTQLNAAAGLTGKALGALGQKAGMAGTQASLATTQAELKGKGAGMMMKGAEGQSAAKLASLAGKGAMNAQGTGMSMDAVSGAADIHSAGADAGLKGVGVEGSMLESGISSVEASGNAKLNQMSGVKQQTDLTESQLDDTVAQSTENYSEEQARLTRAANGTPDEAEYVPPVVVDETTGTTTTPEGVEIEGKAEGGPVQGGTPYIVGEKGRELFTPSQSGHITPNSQMPPSPTEIKQTGDHSFTIEPSGTSNTEGSAPTSKGGVNAPPPPPQLQGAPPQRPVQQAELNQMQSPMPQQAQGGIGPGRLSPLQQGGMMGGISPRPQGNNPETQGKKPQGMMGQGGYDMPISGMKHPNGIAQQGGMMGQNTPMSPEQQQAGDAIQKKRQQAQMQMFMPKSYGMR